MFEYPEDGKPEEESTLSSEIIILCISCISYLLQIVLYMYGMGVG